MVSMLLPAILWNAQQRFLSNFIENSALSPDKAINIDEWLAQNKVKKENVSKLTYIKTTSEGKYWLDKVAYNKLAWDTLYLIIFSFVAIALIVGGFVYWTSL